MKARKRFFLTACLLVCLGIFLGINAFADVRGVTQDSIQLGMILVKTGPVAALGLPEGWGIQDTFNHINETGGINGRKINLIWEDDQFKTPLAISAFNKLIFRDKVLTVTTMGGTPQTIALFDLIDKHQVVNIPNALAEEFFKPHKPYVFVLGASYETQIELMFDYIMNDLKAKDPRIAVVYAETEFGKKGLEAARRRADQYGIKLVSELVLNIGSVDASSQVLSLKKDNVDYVVTCNLVPPIITFLKTAEKYDYWPTTFGINWSCDDMVVKACKAAAKNYIGVNFVGGWDETTPGMILVRDLAKKNDRDPAKMLTSLYTMGVGTALVLAEGMKRAGQNLTPETYKDGLETLKDFETGGIVPPVTYTKTSHAPTTLSRLYKADPEKGIMIPITDWRSPKEMK
ncbi:MAG: branched-chain amino acid transport system substrate-binding protein [Thermodesulfobacteriota bacterium]|nr:branched-chain amino acid transport system substrate-binding protein [Thermodesulfobacteriota bacterium]